jgi:cobalt-zinc-cadmium efflux system outer membrane protein
MRLKSKLLVTFQIAMMGTLMPCLAQQSMPIPQEEMHHHHGDIKPVAPVYPRLGRAQEQAARKLFTLEEAQGLASQSNPTLRQAEAEIRAAHARQQQAGLYPNPTVGYTGDEIRGGSIHGGKQGFFAEQTLVTGGKLNKSRIVLEKEVHLAELETEEQKTRVETSVKIAFYRVLAAQELLGLRRDLSQIALAYSQSQENLIQTGQVDETEMLETEVEAQRFHLAAFEQESSLREEWRQLAAIIGQPDLPQATVAGDLERAWPDINEDLILETISTQSPANRIADATSARAAAEIIRAKSQVIPDLQLRGGFEYNNEPLGTFPQAIGWEGLAVLAVQLPIFNRNQGNVAAAAADLDRAQLEKQRVVLTLRERAASILDQYATSKVMATQYRDSMLPRAKKAYTLMNEQYGRMLASYPRVIQSQRKLFELQLEYVRLLENVWTTGIALQGFLLTDGLEAPARPAEVDRPLRETNLPMPERTMSSWDQIPRP